MSDNKISEAWPDYLMIRDTGLHDDAGGLGQHIFTTAGAGYEKVKYVRADLAHLQGEAVPVANGKLVAWWNGVTPGYDGQGNWSIRWGADAENSAHDIPLYDGYNPIHYQQPAELSEVSGGSGDLGERQPAWNDSARLACLESWAREPGGLLLHAESGTGRRGLGLGENCGNRTLAQAIDSCATHAEKDSFAALAATGKQQVGEAQGSDFDIDDVRELFEKHAKGRDLTPDTWGVSSYVDPYVDNDWNEWVAAWKAIASRQPVGAGDKWLFVESPGEFTERLRAAFQEFDLLGAVRNVLIENPPTLVSRQAVQSIDLAENLLSVLIEDGVLSRNGRVFQKLRGMIDGRDAGAGVE